MLLEHIAERGIELSPASIERIRDVIRPAEELPRGKYFADLQAQLETTTERKVGEFKKRKRIEGLDISRVGEVFGDLPFDPTSHALYDYHDPQNPRSYQRRQDVMTKKHVAVPTLFLPLFGDTNEQITESKRKMLQEIVAKVSEGSLDNVQVNFQQDTEAYLSGDEIKYQVEIIIEAKELRIINGRANKLNNKLLDNHPTMQQLSQQYGVEIQEVMQDFKEQLPSGVDIARDGSVTTCYRIKVVVELAKTKNDIVTCLPVA
jgi:hypothetical protein